MVYGEETRGVEHALGAVDGRSHVRGDPVCLVPLTTRAAKLAAWDAMLNNTMFAFTLSSHVTVDC
jgi:hypothetical protein